MYNRNIAHDNLKVYTMYAVLDDSFAMLKPDPNFVSMNRFMKKKYTENVATFFININGTDHYLKMNKGDLQIIFINH